jgi:hypothetical protein
MGALSFSFVEPEDAAKWVTEYHELLASPECVPAGFAVNPAVAVVLPMMLAADEAEAIDRGIDGAHFFGYSLAHFYGLAKHAPGATDVYAEFLDNRDAAGFARGIVTPDAAPLGVKLLEAGLGSLRGAVGTPAQVAELVARYEAAGVDQVIFVLQAGRNSHDHICESLELFAAEVMPRFVDGREEREAAKRERLAPAIEAALARRPPPYVQEPQPYVIDEQTELEHATPAAHLPTPVALLGQALGGARGAVRRGVESLLGRMVKGADDAQLERRFGAASAQRVLITGMAQMYEPEALPGFEGDVVYELTRPVTDGGTSSWTIEVRGGRASVRGGGSGEAKVTLRLPVADFVRIGAGELDPAMPLLNGRAALKGDLAIAARLPEMFGAPSPY